MTEFLIALVPLAVAAVPILRWPSLQRRLRSHLALLKDVPDGVDAGTLRSLAERELKTVAELDELRLSHSHGHRRRELMGRLALFAVGLTGLVPFALIPEFQDWFLGLTPDWRYLITVYGVALVCVFQWFVSGLSIRYGVARARRKRKPS